MYYYRARYYDAKLGRFLQVDPLRYEGGTNLYTYVHNNPLNMVDPFGWIAEVIIDYGSWHGHAALRIDDHVYTNGRYDPDSLHSRGTRGANILFVMDYDEYIQERREKQAETKGYVLDVTPGEEQKMQAYYDRIIQTNEEWISPKGRQGYNLPDEYSVLSNNCVTTVVEAMQQGLGWFNDFYLNDAFTPHQLDAYLSIGSWIVDREVNYLK